MSVDATAEKKLAYIHQPLLDINIVLSGFVLICILTLTGCSSNNSNDITTAPTNNIAFILTTDFSTGSATVVDLTTRDPFNDVVQQGSVHSDSLARVSNGFVYVVNRLGQDNITRLDPQQDYRFTAQESVGNATNPQDIVVIDSEKAYVSRLASAEIAIIDPTTLLITGNIDLRPFVKSNDTDGFPEAFRMLLHSGVVYLTLQHLDTTNYTSIAPGEIAVIDPTTDTVTTVVALTGNNPFSDLRFSADLNRILVSTVGNFGVNDGGIEAFDPATNTVDTRLIIDEAAIGGDITYFDLVSETKGFAIISDTAFQNALVSFNPSTGQLLNTLIGSSSSFLSQFAINQDGELYLASPDTTTPTPGIRIFDTTQDAEITTIPVNVGSLTPAWVVFIEP